MLGCILARIFIWSENKNKLAVYNLVISAIAELGLGVYSFEHIMGLTEASGTGRGVGAGAVALVEAATPPALTVIKDGNLVDQSVAKRLD